MDDATRPSSRRFASRLAQRNRTDLGGSMVRPGPIRHGRPARREQVLRVRVLGELCVERDGERLRLPPSRRTRALLAYLVLEPREHTRDRLVSLLWELSDDPRAELRWCLSRLRPVVDDESRKRLLADRERVRLDMSAVDFDLTRRLALAARRLASASAGAPERAPGAFPR